MEWRRRRRRRNTAHVGVQMAPCSWIRKPSGNFDVSDRGLAYPHLPHSLLAYMAYMGLFYFSFFVSTPVIDVFLLYTENAVDRGGGGGGHGSFAEYAILFVHAADAWVRNISLTAGCLCLPSPVTADMVQHKDLATTTIAKEHWHSFE